MPGYLETWWSLARAGDPDGDPIPAHLEREFRQYLTGGLLAHGFARAGSADGGHDFRVAFSGPGRGVCPSGGTRRMAATAAHWVVHGFPEGPVQQGVLSLPKWRRYFRHHHARRVKPVRQIVLAEVAVARRSGSLGAPSGARFGAVTVVHRFGSALKAYRPCHGGVIDGVFRAEKDGLRFHPAGLTETAIARVPQQTRRVRKRFERREWLPEEAPALMRGWDHSGGFSLNAEV